MRKKLKKLKQRKYYFQAKVGKVNKKHIVLLNLRFADSKKILTDHCWITYPKKLKKYDFHEGDVIRFSANTHLYFKGDQASVPDYSLSNLAAIRFVRTVNRHNINKDKKAKELELEQHVPELLQPTDEEPELAYADDTEEKPKNIQYLSEDQFYKELIDALYSVLDVPKEKKGI